jgi:nucleotide-binding universal stress UspA family protein
MSTEGGAVFPRIVVPVDGSHFSEAAAGAAATLARRIGVPLTLFGITHSDSDRERIVKGLDDLVASLRRDVVVDVVVDAVGSVMTVGPYVANSILDEADRDGALVCIASHGHTGLGVTLMGSTTEEVLRRSSRPVLVVGPKHEGRPWGEDALLVVSVDGSEFSEHAIPTAAAWSAAAGLPMWLVQVAEPSSGPPPDTVGRGDFNETAYLKSLAQHHPHAQFDVLHSDHPARELADLTSRWPVSLLVMATHGRSGWSRLALGSVAMNVVHHATCPVLVVPPGIAEPADA